MAVAEKVKHVISSSRLPLGVGRIFREAFLNKNYKTRQKIKYYKDLEYNLTVKHLEDCNSTAYFLPFQKAVYAQQHLIRKGLKGLYIGVESNFTLKTTIFLSGVWPKFVLQRQQLLKSETGIIKRWNSILNSSTPIVESEGKNLDKPAGAKMNGNILVIFSVYLVGIAICVLLILGENSWLIGRFLRMICIRTQLGFVVFLGSCKYYLARLWVRFLKPVFSRVKLVT